MTAYAGLFGPAEAVPVAFAGFASASFAVYPIGAYTGTVTLDDADAGGTFNPPTLTFASSADLQTFTYAAVAPGTIAISASGSPALTVLGSPLSLSVYAAPDYDPIAAIQTWWKAQTYLPTLVSGGLLWHLEVPEEALAETYATYFLVSMTPIAHTTGYFIWESVIQFNVHHNLAGTALYVAQQFMHALNSIKSTAAPQIFVQGTQAIQVLPESLGIELGEGLSQNGRDCWVAHFTISLPWTN